MDEGRERRRRRRGGACGYDGDVLLFWNIKKIGR
jgi:hypothetical protein